MTNQTEKQTRELTSADLDHVVAAGAERPTLSDFSIVKTLDKASATGTTHGAGGGGAGKVQMQDFHFMAL